MVAIGVVSFGVDFEVSKFLTTSSTDAHTASRCADRIGAISLSLNKEMAKENQPKGLMPIGNPQDFLLWHICRSCWQDLKHVLRELNQISSCALQSGTEAVSKGGSLWRVSWLLLGACQEVTQKSRTDQRAPQARSMIVKRRRHLKYEFTSPSPRSSP
jgi:hypothetical protein